mmetsp:Transcript_5961/g.13599  ORF Transcript_5961/g.13599 Transcript_5961/m.13599 type:complete len:105 (-) Transcript_5961:6-320(-)
MLRFFTDKVLSSREVLNQSNLYKPVPDSKVRAPRRNQACHLNSFKSLDALSKSDTNAKSNDFVPDEAPNASQLLEHVSDSSALLELISAQTAAALQNAMGKGWI